MLNYTAIFNGVLEMPRVEPTPKIAYVSRVSSYCVLRVDQHNDPIRCDECGYPTYNFRFPIKRMPGWDQDVRCTNQNCWMA